MAESRSFGPTALATPANAVTVARIVGSLACTLLVAADGRTELWALGLFVVLAASDNVDGMLARRQGTTRSGAFLDPLADKILVIGVLGALWVRGVVGVAPVTLVVVREVVISGFRSLAARRGASVPASWLGKVKTLVTFLAIGLLLWPVAGVVTAGRLVLWIAVAVTWISGVHYLVNAGRLIEDGRAGPVPAERSPDAG